MKVFTKILKYVLIVFTSLVLGINIYSLSAKNVGGDPLPMPFGYGTAIVMSGSMEPTLKVGDLVFIKRADYRNLIEGDIAVYYSNNMLVIHRIIDIDEDGMVTFKGDANNVADEPVKGTRVLGSMLTNIPFLGSVILGIRNPISMGILIVATVLLIKIVDNSEQTTESKEKEELEKEIEKLRSELKKEDSEAEKDSENKEAVLIAGRSRKRKK